MTGFFKLVDEDMAWVLVCAIVAPAAPWYNAIVNHDSISILGLTINFIRYFFPTLIMALVASAASSQPLSKKWQIVILAIIFNGYFLEGILSIVHFEPSVFWYAVGGFFGYPIFDFLISISASFKEKFTNIFWKYIDGKINPLDKLPSDEIQSLEGGDRPNERPR